MVAIKQLPNGNVRVAPRRAANDDGRIESAQRLCRAGNEAMRQMMGLYSEGPFSPVQFYIQRGVIVLCRTYRIDSRGVRVASLTNKV